MVSGHTHNNIYTFRLFTARSIKRMQLILIFIHESIFINHPPGDMHAVSLPYTDTQRVLCAPHAAYSGFCYTIHSPRRYGMVYIYTIYVQYCSVARCSSRRAKFVCAFVGRERLWYAYCRIPSVNAIRLNDFVIINGLYIFFIYL